MVNYPAKLLYNKDLFKTVERILDEEGLVANITSGLLNLCGGRS